MTFTPVGASSGGNAASFSLTPHAAGPNFVVLEVNWSTSTTTGASSSNATWAVIAGPTVTGSRTSIVLLGIITSTSAATVTLATSGTPFFAWQEFSATAGAASVTLDAVGTINAAGTAYPSITPGHGAGELYFGFVQNSGTASAGSTTGYTYNANADGNNNGLCYNPSCTSATQAPTWADSNTKSGIAVLLYEAVAAPPYTLLTPPGRTPPVAFRFRSMPSQAPVLVPAGDAGASGDTAAASTAQAPSFPLIPPGTVSPMAFQRRSPVMPALPVTVPASDTGTGTDTGTVTAMVTGSDTGTGTDSATGAQGASDTDAGAGADTQALEVTGADTGSAREESSGGGTLHFKGTPAYTLARGAAAGTVTLNGTTAVPVTTGAVSASSLVMLTVQPGTAPAGLPYVASAGIGSGFTVKSTSSSDTAVNVAWAIVEAV